MYMLRRFLVIQHFHTISLNIISLPWVLMHHIYQLFSPNYDEVRIRRKPPVSRFDERAAPLISGACLYIRKTFIPSNAHSSCNSYRHCNDRWSYYEALSGCLKAAFIFPVNVKFLNFLAVGSIDVGLFW